jgi:hypothetical protein
MSLRPERVVLSVAWSNNWIKLIRFRLPPNGWLRHIPECVSGDIGYLQSVPEICLRSLTEIFLSPQVFFWRENTVHFLEGFSRYKWSSLIHAVSPICKYVVWMKRMRARAGLPDFSWYNIPKREKCTK